MQKSNDNSHEHFEELCSLAAGGQIAADELQELEEHLRGCERCRESLEEATALANLLHGEAGTVFAERPRLVLTMPARKTAEEGNRAWMRTAAALLLGVLAGAGAAAGWLHSHGATQPALAGPATTTAQTTQPTTQEPTRANATAATSMAAESADLAAARGEIARLETELRSAHTGHDAAGAATTQEQAQLTAARQEATLYRADSAAQRVLAGDLAAQLAQLKTANDEAARTVASRDNQIRELNADLFASRHGAPSKDGSSDVANILGERNLHVIDVYDNTPHGQRAAPFGRIFYGEGQSLLFYAFDLPLKPDSGKVVVQAWGQKEGRALTPVRLGEFSRNNGNDTCWTLRIQDPAQLSNIDAVFVTMERRPEKRPTGAPLLYAYLRQSPNHP